MNELKDVLAAFAKLCKYPDDLSNARLTKLVYLSDWRHSLKFGKPITGIKWYFDNYGPFVFDVIDTVKEHRELFRLTETANMHGNKKQLISLADPDYVPKIDKSAAEVIDLVTDFTSGMNFQDFLRTVYSTYPVTTSPRYSHLDLPTLAERFRSERRAAQALPKV